MKKLRKPISLLLILTILAAVLTAAPFTVSAAGCSLAINQPAHGEIVLENYKDDGHQHRRVGRQYLQAMAEF